MGVRVHLPKLIYRWLHRKFTIIFRWLEFSCVATWVFVRRQLRFLSSVAAPKIHSFITSCRHSFAMERGEKPPIDGLIRFGFAFLLLFVGGFLLWANTATLETATIANGKVVVKSHHRTMQHLEGGIVKHILVKDGDVVKAGQKLIVLDSTTAEAALILLQTKAMDLLVAQSRLKAERDKMKKIVWVPELHKFTHTNRLKNLKASATSIFYSNLKSQHTQLAILKKRIKQLHKQISSIQSQVQSESEQLTYVQEEVDAVASLEKKKLVAKPRLFAIQRERSRLIGNRGQHMGLIAKAEQEIGETQQRMLSLQHERHREVVSELHQVEQELSGVIERMQAARQVLKRTIITAPQSGIISSLAIHTVGGVIAPGEKILDIVPDKDELIVAAKISPLDIDVVHAGLSAKVRLVAFKQRQTPSLDGHVIFVSADTVNTVNSQQLQESYYLARIAIELPKGSVRKSVVDKNSQNLHLYPGMPVQVMIITDNRTLMQYLLDPLRQSFANAFHES